MARARYPCKTIRCRCHALRHPAAQVAAVRGNFDYSARGDSRDVHYVRAHGIRQLRRHSVPGIADVDVYGNSEPIAARLDPAHNPFGDALSACVRATCRSIRLHIAVAPEHSPKAERSSRFCFGVNLRATSLPRIPGLVYGGSRLTHPGLV